MGIIKYYDKRKYINNWDKQSHWSHQILQLQSQDRSSSARIAGWDTGLGPGLDLHPSKDARGAKHGLQYRPINLTLRSIKENFADDVSEILPCLDCGTGAAIGRVWL